MRRLRAEQVATGRGRRSLAIGVLGLVPVVTSGYVEAGRSPAAARRRSSLGVFQVSVLLDLVYVALGAAGLLLAGTAELGAAATSSATGIVLIASVAARRGEGRRLGAARARPTTGSTSGSAPRLLALAAYRAAPPADVSGVERRARPAARPARGGRARRSAAGARVPRRAAGRASGGRAERRRCAGRCCSWSRAATRTASSASTIARSSRSRPSCTPTPAAAAWRRGSTSSRSRARPAARPRGGALPRRRHRPRVAAVRARADRRTSSPS